MKDLFTSILFAVVLVIKMFYKVAALLVGGFSNWVFMPRLVRRATGSIWCELAAVCVVVYSLFIPAVYPFCIFLGLVFRAINRNALKRGLITVKEVA